MTEPCYHLYQNSQVIYCATSLEECWEVFLQDMEFGAEEAASAKQHGPFELIPDDDSMEMGSEDEYGEPGEIQRRVRHRDGKWGGFYFFLTKTAGEWAAGCGESRHFSGEM